MITIDKIEDCNNFLSYEELVILEQAFTRIHCRVCKTTLANLCYTKDGKFLTAGFKLFIQGFLYARGCQV